MAHLRHHEDMGDLGLALLSSGTTVFLAMISAFFAIRLFRELRPPQTPRCKACCSLTSQGSSPSGPSQGRVIGYMPTQSQRLGRSGARNCSRG